MREYAARRGWTIALQVKEVGSGAAQRELREKLLEAARRREIDVVLVWRLDRWGRSVADLLATLQELEHLGVGFVSLTEALDLTTPAGRAMAALLAVFAEFEREILRERIAGDWPTPGRTETSGPTATAAYKPQRFGNCIALASANPRSPAAWISAAPRCAEFWKQSHEETEAKTRSGKTASTTSHRGRLRAEEQAMSWYCYLEKNPISFPGQCIAPKIFSHSGRERPSKCVAWRRKTHAPPTCSC